MIYNFSLILTVIGGRLDRIDYSPVSLILLIRFR